MEAMEGCGRQRCVETLRRGEVRCKLAPDDPRHGRSAGYLKGGCRCDDCADWRSEYDRDRKARGIPDDDPRHGTRAGFRAGCDCDACVQADREYKREHARDSGEHGTWVAMHNRCDCADCAAWRRADGARKRKARKGRGLPEGDPRHGTPSAQVTYGCDCSACTAAAAAYRRQRDRKWRARRAQAALTKAAAALQRAQSRRDKAVRSALAAGVNADELADRLGITRAELDAAAED